MSTSDLKHDLIRTDHLGQGHLASTVGRTVGRTLKTKRDNFLQ